MEDFDPHSHGYDKEQPTSTPFRFRHTRRKRPALFKQVKSVVTQSPLLLVLVVTALLVFLGWFLAPTWAKINSSLLTTTQSRSPATSASTQVATVVATSTSVSAKMGTPVHTPLPATPAATPQLTPSTTPTPVETKRANVTAPAHEEDGRFTLQVGAYQNQAEAESKVARMKELGYEARIIRVMLPGKGVWHRLQVGRFATRDAASHFGQQLQAQKSISDFAVIAYQAASN